MSLVAFLARELAPTHRRFVEAARTALKTSVTVAIAATLQILGPFGALFAFVIGQPGISVDLFDGGLTIAVAAVVQAAIVPITGKLLDYPGLIMVFLFLVFAMVAYLLSNTKLLLILMLVVVGTISTVYVGIFEPGQIGWGSAYTFDGIAAATLVMVAIDTWIWPSRAEPRLLESVAADFESSRRRLEMVGRRYLDPLAASLPGPQLAPGRLAPHLALLKSIEKHEKPTPRHLALLLDAVVTAERVFMEVERLAVLADELVPDEIRQRYHDQIEGALDALDEVLAKRTGEALAEIPDTTSSAATELRERIARLSESARLFATEERPITIGASNLVGFVGVLEVIENLLEPPLLGAVAIEMNAADDSSEPHRLFDPDRVRFSVKLGTTMVLGLLVGLTTQRADLQTILWSIVVAGHTNQYGAVLRKSLLRLAGCIIGGLATLGAMLLVSQNFDSLPPYVVAIFAVTLFAAYVAQSSDWLNYAGVQAGVTFLICYVGPGPSTDIYRPLWRFWGIVLGILTTGFVFLLLWPEYASDKLIDSLAKLMRTTLVFGKEIADGMIPEGRIAAVEQRLSANLLEALNLADQARLEGLQGLTNSTNGVDAAATVIGIAYRFQVILRARMRGAEAAMPNDMRERCHAWEKEYCIALETRTQWLESTRLQDPAAPLPPFTIDSKYLSTEPAIALSSESADLAAQLESYRRLPILIETLDRALSQLKASKLSAHGSDSDDQ